MRCHLRNSWNQNCFVQRSVGCWFQEDERSSVAPGLHSSWRSSEDMYKGNPLSFNLVIGWCFPTHVSCLNYISGASPSPPSPGFHWRDWARFCVPLSFCLSWAPALCSHIPLRCPLCASLHCIFWNTNSSHILILIIVLDSYPELWPLQRMSCLSQMCGKRLAGPLWTSNKP